MKKSTKILIIIFIMIFLICGVWIITDNCNNWIKEKTEEISEEKTEEISEEKTEEISEEKTEEIPETFERRVEIAEIPLFKSDSSLHEEYFDLLVDPKKDVMEFIKYVKLEMMDLDDFGLLMEARIPDIREFITELDEAGLISELSWFNLDYYYDKCSICIVTGNSESIYICVYESKIVFPNCSSLLFYNRIPLRKFISFLFGTDNQEEINNIIRSLKVIEVNSRGY